ncbi:hypothetical protein FEM48_Zijuj01G0036400 [Ziziphus jujuba var. spinosa]|uniref:GDSL esterase/lipase At5g45950 n=1 Tax=Ziziphus jujuba var. spinosa TaxID=714518 RepID=A0A978VYY0_ZIZJJ|nr:hypothetical protein FEM48_Zijuj01G0036400 [Ziziphus jujuba var. spinosa]
MMEIIRVTLVGMILFLALMPILLLQALDIGQVRALAARNNVTCVLVFGDSSVDPGNNNVLHTTAKGNFLPYGKNFFGGQPTGRFSDGRLSTDFIADEIFGYRKIIPAYLSSNMKETNLIHGVSFASAASGYDELTANLSGVLSIPKQLEYFMHYKVKLQKLVGEQRAEYIIKNAIIVLSMGTNDFLQNYYVEPIRSKEYTVEEYQNFLVSRVDNYIKEMYRIGGRRLVVVGVPPMGCMPLVLTIWGDGRKCVDTYNNVAFSFNSKIQKELVTVRSTIGMRTAFVDAFTIIQHAVNSPQKYGLEETSKGCCGSGTIEYGDSCRGMSTCKDPSKYVFWDAVHPTQKMYKILADEAVESLNQNLLA